MKYGQYIRFTFAKSTILGDYFLKTNFEALRLIEDLGIVRLLCGYAYKTQCAHKRNREYIQNDSIVKRRIMCYSIATVVNNLPCQPCGRGSMRFFVCTKRMDIYGKVLYVRLCAYQPK